jgi:3-hydroxyisobutyrate dehydrogenase
MTPDAKADAAAGAWRPHVGFVGLGRMGRPMASRLVRAGFSVTGFDVDRSVAQRFASETAAAIAVSPAQLGAASDVVITMVANGEVVREVILGASSAAKKEVPLIDSLRPGAIVIDMSSSAPTGTRRLGADLAARSVALLDAPVSGGVVRAEAGTLSIMAGGDPTTIARCRPLFDAMGERVFATGPLGSGHAMKALNNLVSAAGLLAAAEALLVGRRFGLDPNVMIDVFNASTARNNSTENKFKQFVFSRRFSSGFPLALMVKDLATALDLAEATATPAPFGARCRELWSTAAAQLEGGADHTAVVQWLERLAGTSLANDRS